MKQPLHQNMPNRQKNFWLDLKNLMKSLSLKEEPGPRLRRVAPCPKRILKIASRLEEAGSNTA